MLESRHHSLISEFGEDLRAYLMMAAEQCIASSFLPNFEGYEEVLTTSVMDNSHEKINKGEIHILFYFYTFVIWVGR